MIYHPISTLVKSGIKHIVVITGGPLANQVVEMVGYLKPNFKGVNFEFARQEKPLGMPDAIACAGPFARKEPIIVVAGDNIFGGDYKKYVTKFVKGEISFLRKVPDPSRFGCPFYDKDKNLIAIVEKPIKPQSKYAITGPHIFDYRVFSFIKTLTPSKRGELEIVDLHKKYLSLKELKLIKVRDFWADIGTFKSLAKVSYHIFKLNDK